MPTATVDIAPPKTVGGNFEARMGTIFIVLALVAFMPSYWLPLARGSIDVPVAVHLHGALFFGWLVLFRVQAGLAAAGKFAIHRPLGWVGAGLAVAMPFAIFVLQSILVPQYDVQGFHDQARGFAWVNVSDMIIFCGLVIAAIANVRRPAVHRRIMLAATASLIAIPIGRIMLAIGRFADLLPPANGGPPPVAAAYAPHILSWLPILIAAVHDRHECGKTPQSYLCAIAAMAIQLLTLALVGFSPAWAAIADVLFAHF